MTWFDLKGDERLGRCAGEGCGGQPTSRLEVGGVGSNYCSGCRNRIDAATATQAMRMEKRVCACGRLYSDGPMITTDWAYWERNKDKVTCPECLGIDVAAEINAIANQ